MLSRCGRHGSDKYVWSFVTYFVGAATAGILDLLSDSIGFIVIFRDVSGHFFHLPHLPDVFEERRNIDAAGRTGRKVGQNTQRAVGQLFASRKSGSEALSRMLRSASRSFRPTANGLRSIMPLCTILGYSEAEFLAMDFQSIIFPEDLGTTLVKIHELISGKTVNCQMEQRYLHKAGQTVWASWSVSTASDCEIRRCRISSSRSRT